MPSSPGVSYNPEAMSASIRYFCIVGNQVAFEYLGAISTSISGVSAAPIGPMFLYVPPWNAYAKLFGREVGMKFVNIVCALPGLSLGARVVFDEDRDGTSYEPDTAFSGLYTVGVPNVAIVAGVNGQKEAAEVLNLYNLVVCPTSDIKQALDRDGIGAEVVAPGDFLDRIADMIP